MPEKIGGVPYPYSIKVGRMTSPSGQSADQTSHSSISSNAGFFLAVSKKNSSPKKLKDSKKTQANFPKTHGSANSEDRIPPNFWTIL